MLIHMYFLAVYILYKDPGPTLLDHYPVIDVYQVGKSYGIERLFIFL